MFVESLDAITQQLEGLQKLLPDFEQDMELYPTDSSLRLHLKELYTDYVDFRIIVVRNLTRTALGKKAA